MKEPFGGPETVVKYIGRYTHRVAISDSRLQAISDRKVAFSYKRYRDNKVYPGTMTLSSDEFIRRFLLHVIPKGFKRIRHFGFLASACRREALAAARRLLTAAAEKLANVEAEFSQWVEQPNKQMRCPECKTGVLEIWEVISPRSLAPG
jgi:hypothetical protein